MYTNSFFLNNSIELLLIYPLLNQHSTMDKDKNMNQNKDVHITLRCRSVLVLQGKCEIMQRKVYIHAVTLHATDVNYAVNSYCYPSYLRFKQYDLYRVLECIFFTCVKVCNSCVYTESFPLMWQVCCKNIRILCAC